MIIDDINTHQQYIVFVPTSKKTFTLLEAVLKERISSCCIHHKVKLGLLALGKSKYGTWDSQNSPTHYEKFYTTLDD